MLTLLKAPKEDIKPLTDTESHVLLAMLSAELSSGEKPYDYDRPLADYFKEAKRAAQATETTLLFLILKQRLSTYGVKITAEAMVLIVVLSKSPGEIVMWAFAIFYWYTENKNTFSVGVFCDVFPWGIPTPEYRYKVWDSQKRDPKLIKPGEMDNRLDTEPWPNLAIELGATTKS